MGIKITDTNHIPDLIRTLKQLERKHIEVGVFGSDDSFMAMIATVHEFGLTIKAKKRFLAIPTKAAGDKGPREFNDLVFIETGPNKGVLVKQEKGRGRTGARSTVYFVLVPSVKIPERSFMRSTFDEEAAAWSRFAGQQLGKVMGGELSFDIFFERIGQRIVADIQAKIQSINHPSNASITRQRKGSSNPLIDSGRMRQSVTYKVVST